MPTAFITFWMALNIVLRDRGLPEALFGEARDAWRDDDNPDGDYIDFADPGGNSALRAASQSNPRNLPCQTCRRPNRLTPADQARGYQCDACADKAERGLVWDD